MSARNAALSVKSMRPSLTWGASAGYLAARAVKSGRASLYLFFGCIALWTAAMC